MNEQTYELIDQYLNGELNSAEVADIEQRLKTDPVFAQTVTIQRQLFSALADRFEREEEETALKETLQKISGQHFVTSTAADGQQTASTKQNSTRQETTETKSPSNVVRMLYAVAAVAAILLIFIWSPWQQSLPDQYYSTPQIALTSRGDDTCEASKIDQQYRNGLFAEALPLIETCLQAKPDYAELRFAKGICLLETGNIKTSLQTLDGLKENATYKYEAFWYSAMAHLKTGNKEAAAKLLQQIPASADHGEEAAELLKKL